MKFSLFENGIDSLKATYLSLDAAKHLDEGKKHHIKDATISLNHANEILLKNLLKDKHDFLIFTDLQAYMNAKTKIGKEGKLTVFDANPNLKTVSLHEAMRRLVLLCDIEFPEHFINSLEELSKERNKIMHYAIELDEPQYQDFLKQLEICYELTIHFFSQHYSNFESLINDARFEYSFEPDVESLAKESYFDWLSEQDEN